MVVSSASVLLGVVYISNVALGYMRAIIPTSAAEARSKMITAPDDLPALSGRICVPGQSSVITSGARYCVGGRPLSTGAT
jgi:hypothetical protein